jgi:T5orf172 domain
MSEGYVYVLTNAAMPGYVKIGLTQQDDVADRVRQLDNTSTPLPFEVYYAAKVPDCRKLERTLHFVFGEKRARLNREFFTADPDLAKAVIELVAIKEEALSDAEQAISPEQRTEIDQTKRDRAERITLGRLGLSPGTILTFSKDPQITCEVAGPKTVHFRGTEQSLSQAALTVIREMGYNWPSARGAEYWTHAGVKLADMQPLQPGDLE